MYMISLSPSDICYSQDSIKAQFRDGRYLIDTFHSLLYDQIDVADIETLTVLQENGQWFALHGNRRLYIYKKLHSIGKVGEIKVKVTDNYRDLVYFEENRERGSHNIRVRGRNNLAADMNNMVRIWNISKRKTPNRKRPAPDIPQGYPSRNYTTPTPIYAYSTDNQVSFTDTLTDHTSVRSTVNQVPRSTPVDNWRVPSAQDQSQSRHLEANAHNVRQTTATRSAAKNEIMFSYDRGNVEQPTALASESQDINNRGKCCSCTIL